MISDWAEFLTETTVNLDDVAFPALIIADDGWVDYLESRQGLSTWTPAAISKYRKRRVLLYDSNNQAWEVESIVRLGTRSGSILARLFNSAIPVSITIRSTGGSSEQLVQTVLSAAIDEDDDILTQFTDKADLKRSIRKADSFQSLVHALRAKRAI